MNTFLKKSKNAGGSLHGSDKLAFTRPAPSQQTVKEFQCSITKTQKVCFLCEKLVANSQTSLFPNQKSVFLMSNSRQTQTHACFPIKGRFSCQAIHGKHPNMLAFSSDIGFLTKNYDKHLNRLLYSSKVGCDEKFRQTPKHVYVPLKTVFSWPRHHIKHPNKLVFPSKVCFLDQPIPSNTQTCLFSFSKVGFLDQQITANTRTGFISPSPHKFGFIENLQMHSKHPNIFFHSKVCCLDGKIIANTSAGLFCNHKYYKIAEA